MPEYFAALDDGDLEWIQSVALSLLAPVHTRSEVDVRIRELLIDNLPGQLTMGSNWIDDPPTYPRLTSIRVPTLAVAGDRDAAASPASRR